MQSRLDAEFTGNVAPLVLLVMQEELQNKLHISWPVRGYGPKESMCPLNHMSQ